MRKVRGPYLTLSFPPLRVPLFAEDPSFTPKLRAGAESIFQRKNEITKLDYEFRDYKGKKCAIVPACHSDMSTGTVHGFGSRPDLGNPVIKKAFEQSMDQGVGWFQKTLGL